MVEASHVAEPATPSLEQHPYPAEEVILVAPNTNNKENKKKTDRTLHVVPACPPSATVTSHYVWNSDHETLTNPAHYRGYLSICLSIYCASPISKPAMMQLKRYLQLTKLLLYDM
ncbi:conserved hypothetical protein [Trichinella spiralis]|uniref:hypothetical protein n=1 Tax=Trichinella spiralis TaxID=6334 RepID=UPI0001EFEBBB|nr:conserved hypothetical protein [Trichinella spiralis]